jgi:hypothetical protein
MITFDRAVLESAERTCADARRMRDEARRARQERQYAVGPSGVQALTEELRAARNKVENLEIALTSARRIGMALGILMERYQFTDAQAFDALRTVSQRKHCKLRDLAEQVALTGDFTV